MTRTSALPAALIAFLAVACGPMETDDAGLALDPSDATPLFSSSSSDPSGLRLSALSVTAGATLTGTVSASKGALVYLTFPKSIFAGKGWVRIPKDGGSATFTLYSNPFVAAPTTATISARTSSPDPASAFAQSVSVQPSATPPTTARPQVSSAVLGPATVTSGTSSTLALTLSAPAPAGGAAVLVAITNDFLGLDADVDAVVLVPAGATSASTLVRTHLSSSAATSRTENVVANYFGGTFQGGALLVIAP